MGFGHGKLLEKRQNKVIILNDLLKGGNHYD